MTNKANILDNLYEAQAFESGAEDLIADMELASGKIAIGQSTGLAAGMTPSGNLAISNAGVCTVQGALAGLTSISVAGTVTAIAFTGSYTGNAIDFGGATITPTVAGSNGPCFIRLGTYAAPYDYGDNDNQSGVMRIYTTCDGSASYDRGLFAYAEVTEAKSAYPVAGLVEANNTGTGPSSIGGAQFIAHLGAQSSGAHLATLSGGSASYWCGMYGVWAKVAAAGTAVCDSGSRVAPIWVDSQMSGTISGEEFGIFATTGASRPNGFIGFKTSSSGYDYLFYFDDTFDAGAGTCVETSAVPGGNQTARIKVYYDTTAYYIPLYE